MGMYDEINVTCPGCSETLIYQSKSGPCCLGTYSLDNAPLEMLSSIEGDSEWCNKCEKEIKLVYLDPLNFPLMPHDLFPYVVGSGKVTIDITIEEK